MGLLGHFPILVVALAACTFDIAAASYGSGDLTILASTDLTGEKHVAGHLQCVRSTNISRIAE